MRYVSTENKSENLYSTFISNPHGTPNCLVSLDSQKYNLSFDIIFYSFWFLREGKIRTSPTPVLCILYYILK